MECETAAAPAIILTMQRRRVIRQTLREREMRELKQERNKERQIKEFKYVCN